MAFGRELPDDLTADVLRRLPPRNLAVSRCVCRWWRDLVDARRLLRADLLPRSVGGIFMHYCALYTPEFLARPTTGRRPSISGSGGLDFVPDGLSNKVLDQDHCNGLLLCTGAAWDSHDDYVANPATRRWERLPRRPRRQMGRRRRKKNKAFHQGQIKCLVYDPTVSPHYEVFFIGSDQQQLKVLAFVYSSVTGRWEERFFVPEGGEGGRVVEIEEAIADTRLFLPEGRASVAAADIADAKVYWRGALYLPHQNGFMRISISNANYRLIPMPASVEFRSYLCHTLGRSEKGVYCASEYDWHGLQIFFLNESCGQQAVWELKHSVDFTAFSRKLGALNAHSDQQNGPWMLQDINYCKYQYRCYGNDKHKEVVEDKFEWNSDDDNVLSAEDTVDGHYTGSMSFLGFHPYKEIVYLKADLWRAVAYHWNTSKFQDLGNICPKEYHEISGRFAGIETSFVYTPCWMDEGFPEVEKNSKFWSIILYNETKYHTKILEKKVTILHFGFWLQEAKKKAQRASRDHNEDNKFCILDETNPEHFGILYFIIPK